MDSNKIIADELRRKAGHLASKTLERHESGIQSEKKMYTAEQETHYLNDTVFTINYLADSIRMGQPAFFENYIAWFAGLLPSINISEHQMIGHFKVLEGVIGEELGAETSKAIAPLIRFAVDNIGQEMLAHHDGKDQPNLNAVAQEYLSLLLRGDRSQAVSLILKQVEGKSSIKDIYLNVFQASQYEIGKLWQTNKITVAQEHFVTAATQYAMSHLYPYIFKEQPGDRKLVSTCIQGELHELGARMVTDFFEMEGWDTNYLGANTPNRAIVSFIKEHQPHLVAISATLMTNVAAVSDLISNIRSSANEAYQPLIMVGGYPFKAIPDLWKQVGADAFASHAEEAIRVADQIVTKL